MSETKTDLFDSIKHHTGYKGKSEPGLKFLPFTV